MLSCVVTVVVMQVLGSGAGGARRPSGGEAAQRFAISSQEQLQFGGGGVEPGTIIRTQAQAGPAHSLVRWAELEC